MKVLKVGSGFHYSSCNEEVLQFAYDTNRNRIAPNTKLKRCNNCTPQLINHQNFPSIIYKCQKVVDCGDSYSSDSTKCVFFVVVEVKKKNVWTDSIFCSFDIFTAKLRRDSRILLLLHIQTMHKFQIS